MYKIKNNTQKLSQDWEKWKIWFVLKGIKIEKEDNHVDSANGMPLVIDKDWKLKKKMKT